MHAPNVLFNSSHNLKKANFLLRLIDGQNVKPFLQIGRSMACPRALIANKRQVTKFWQIWTESLIQAVTLKQILLDN